jgi:hypothetical protein
VVFWRQCSKFNLQRDFFTPLESVVVQLFSFTVDFHFILSFFHFFKLLFQSPPIFSPSAKVWRKHFQSPHIFSSSAKVWRKHFQSLHIFSSSAKVWGKHFQSAPISSSDANNFKKRLGFHLFQTC